MGYILWAYNYGTESEITFGTLGVEMGMARPEEMPVSIWDRFVALAGVR